MPNIRRQKLTSTEAEMLAISGYELPEIGLPKSLVCRMILSDVMFGVSALQNMGVMTSSQCRGTPWLRLP